MIAPKPVHRRGEGRGCDGIALTHHLQATMGILSGDGIALNRGHQKGGLPGRVDGIALKPPKALQRKVDRDALTP